MPNRNVLVIHIICLQALFAACSDSGSSAGPADEQTDDEDSPAQDESSEQEEERRDAGTRKPDSGAAKPTDAGRNPKPPAGDSGQAVQPPPGTTDPVEPGSSAAGGPISKDCQGFPLEGLMESPGGDVLPNKCEPFHPTLNNPYAVRCIDAWPWYKTPYAGDEYCILPPPADKGIQVGFHPQQDKYWEQISSQDLSGYDNPGAEWLLDAGGESTTTYHAPTPLAEPKEYYRTYFRMRTGSHHNIISMHDDDKPAGWDPVLGEALPAFFDLTAGGVTGILGGQERPDDSTPVTLERPPEDEGLYYHFPANPNIYYNVHHFNTTENPILKEGWVNVWWEENGTKLTSWFMGLSLLQPVVLSIAPGEIVDLHYTMTPSESVRLVRFFGHRHVWTTNFSSWIERKDGAVDMIYQSFDWMDMPTYRYDSVVKNPVPNHAQRIDGGSSGILTVEAGDTLHFNCHIEYTEERAAEENAPSPRMLGTIGFANQALTAEMCIAYGNVVGNSFSLGSPVESSTPMPAEAQQ